MDELRLELYKNIESYGFNDPRTIAISQALDIQVTKEQIRINKFKIA